MPGSATKEEIALLPSIVLGLAGIERANGPKTQLPAASRGKNIRTPFARMLDRLLL